MLEEKPCFSFLDEFCFSISTAAETWEQALCEESNELWTV